MKNEEMARLFSEATPYIQKYHGKTMVVKYGGNAMINEELKNAVMNDLVTLTLLGVRVVLVHGGGLVVCAGANVVVDRMDQSFLANVNERAVQLRAGIAKLPHVKSISGIGLMVGIEFYDLKAADVLAACREAGLLVLTAKTRLRLLPPLTLSEHDVDMALEILSDVLGKMEPTAPKEQA